MARRLHTISLRIRSSCFRLGRTFVTRFFRGPSSASDRRRRRPLPRQRRAKGDGSLRSQRSRSRKRWCPQDPVPGTPGARGRRPCPRPDPKAPMPSRGPLRHRRRNVPRYNCPSDKLFDIAHEESVVARFLSRRRTSHWSSLALKENWKVAPFLPGWSRGGMLRATTVGLENNTSNPTATLIVRRRVPSTYS